MNFRMESCNLAVLRRGILGFNMCTRIYRNLNFFVQLGYIAHDQEPWR